MSHRLLAAFGLAVLVALASCNQHLPLPVSAVPTGLPALPEPNDNAATAAKVALGRMLFMDRRLSHNNTLSCAMCHVPEQGFTSQELRTAVGVEGRSGRRNAPTLYNVAYVEQLFHDGREFSLENQVWGPLLSSNEMDNPSIGYVIEKIKVLPDYRGRFEAAFEGHGPDMLRLGQALAAYQRSLLSANSRFDRWYFQQEPTALSTEEQAGFALFTGKARCIACHLAGSKAALFTDQGFHNTGIGFANSMGLSGTHHVQLAPGVFVEVDDTALANFEARPADTGRYEVTLDPADSWAYRTPGLRNVALTAPYMHDGSLSTLEEVVDFYDHGAIDNPQKDPLLLPLDIMY